MELKGTITRLLPMQTGTGKNGEWKKQEFVLETQDQYPKQVCFSLWGEKIDKYTIAEGEEVVVAFNLESREYNERWYTDARAWRITKSEGVSNTAPPPVDEPPYQDSSNSSTEETATDDLPF